MGDPQGAPRSQSGMKIIWSPEAVDDLASLRAHIAQTTPRQPNASPCTSCIASRSCFRRTRSLATPAACPARANS